LWQDYKELFLGEEEAGQVKAERLSTDEESSAFTGLPNLLLFSFFPTF